MREYSSAPSADSAPAEVRQFTFKLDKVPFTATLRGDANAVLEWSELAGHADAADTDLESAEGVAFIAKFFKLMMLPAEYKRFKAHLAAHKTDSNILGQIMQDLQVEMNDLLEDETDRPTSPSSDLSAGQPVTEDRMSMIASIPGGDVVGLPAPGIIGPTPEQQAAMSGRTIVAEPGDVVTIGKWQPGVPLDQQMREQYPPRPAVRRQQKPGAKRRRAG